MIDGELLRRHRLNIVCLRGLDCGFSCPLIKIPARTCATCLRVLRHSQTSRYCLLLALSLAALRHFGAFASPVLWTRGSFKLCGQS